MTDPDPRVAAEVAVDPSATLLRGPEGWVLGMTRDLRHDPERVWLMLTDPVHLARWSPVVPDRVLDSVGPATCRENPGDEPADATVLRADPPRELVHRWGEHTVRWTITPLATGSRLELRHTFADPAYRGSFAGGWHICLATLAATYDGTADVDVERVVGRRAVDHGWEPLRERYDAELVAGTDA